MKRTFTVSILGCGNNVVDNQVEVNNSAVTVLDVEGKEIPFANVTCEALPVFNRDNAIFKAKIPAMGYTVYYFEPTGDFNRVDINKPMPAPYEIKTLLIKTAKRKKCFSRNIRIDRADSSINFI